MPYDIETDNDYVRLLDTAELTADHIYINDVDMVELADKITKLEDKLDTLTAKVDSILQLLSQKDNNMNSEKHLMSAV
jgi:hypothetical protein